MKDSNYAVVVKDLHKSFKLPVEQESGIKQRIINTLSGKGKKGYEVQKVLKGISFNIEKGDFFGIVGRNGSGKSTLLKTLAGIYNPDKGSVFVNGSLVPFIELGVGFNPELTGRENVYLNGALLGFSRDEMKSMYKDIVEFAELEKFMDQKLKNYSSGMQVRLAFSIAIRANGDILLLDEVLAVGDEAFQRKCYDYFGELKRNGKTVILVTHSMAAVEEYCNKAMLIEGGEIKKVGSSTEVADMYSNLFIKDAERKNNDSPEGGSNDNTDQSGPVNLSSVKVKQDGGATGVVEAFKPFEVEIVVRAEDNVGSSAFGVNIVNSKGVIVLAMGMGSRRDEALEIKKGINRLNFSVKNNIYTDDSYFINVALESIGHKKELLLKKREVGQFSIKGVIKRRHSLTHPEVESSVEYEKVRS